MILDTTVIIDLMKGEEKISEKIKELQSKNITLFTTSINVFEIWQGVYDMENKERLNKINTLLDSIGIYLFDIPSSKVAGKIHSTLRKDGKIIDPEDSMIAGIAKLNNETLLTRNIKHFERIEDLKVESY